MQIMSASSEADYSVRKRARGCLLGQLAGDSLGSLVEFRTRQEILSQYPEGVRQLADGGTWNTIAGQPTDDSEMALALARTLLTLGRYEASKAREAYESWLDSEPFDCGMTIASGLRGRPNPESQANGAMMRISPLGIFGAHLDLKTVVLWASQDAAITHPHPVCQQANALYAKAIAYVIREGCSAKDLFYHIVQWATDMKVPKCLLDAVHGSSKSPPADYLHQQGWVLIAFRNALWQLLHAASFEEAVVDTVMQGGDTDTNAAICGALLGAVYGIDAVPAQWIKALLNCRPEKGRKGFHRPRPERFWPVDALELADRLVDSGLRATDVDHQL